MSNKKFKEILKSAKSRSSSSRSYSNNKESSFKISGMIFNRYFLGLVAITVSGYYVSNLYYEYTRGETIASVIKESSKNTLLEKINNFHSQLLNNTAEKAKENDSIIYKEMEMFLSKFGESLKNDVKDVQTNKDNKVAKEKVLPEKRNYKGEPLDNINLNDRQKEFIAKHLPSAKLAQEKTGIPAVFLIGQAGHETGWGRSEILNSDGTLSYNLFGIKATGGWTGKKTTITTTENYGGKNVKIKDAFRAYSSYEESFLDYAKLINNSSRYSRAKEIAQEFSKELQSGGYATDPNYADKLSKSINTVSRYVK